MPVSPKVFVSEKRDCTFWKWRNGRTSALKWRKSRMHRMKMKDFKDQNVLIFLYQQYVLVFKSSDANVTHFKAEVLPFRHFQKIQSRFSGTNT